MELERYLKKPNIFEYSDYRVFLKEFYLFMKADSSFFSFRYFSKVAGFQSPNFLKLVIEGQRNLSNESTQKFCRGLKLTKRESIYFSILVRFSQATELDQKSKLARELTESKTLQKINPLKSAELKYYSRWYYIAVRELASSPHFREDPAWIANVLCPKISLEEAGTALRELMSLGLLVRTEKGQLVQRESSLNTQNEMPFALIAQYHREIIQLAGESIKRFRSAEREISAITIPLSLENFQKLKIRIQELREEFLNISENDPSPEKVFQINLQMFPLTENIKEFTK